MDHSLLHRVLAVVLVAVIVAGTAQATAGDLVDRTPLLDSRLYLEISPDGRDDLEALFKTLEQSLLAGEPQAQPVVIILQGPEALPFIRRNYPKNRNIVDRAAKLQAFHRIDLRMCETWMQENGFDKGDLVPFVDTVPLAPAELERLKNDGYVPYGASAPRSDLL